MRTTGRVRGLRQSGFTLVELLLVIAIMGLLGTVSVSGFYGLKKGMEQRGVKQSVDEFVRAAYRRAVIDRVPTAIYFWNETLSDESDELGGKLSVVGHAVAVRRAGRISWIKDDKYLVDEFGDLADEVMTDEDGDEDDSTDFSKDVGRYLYPFRPGDDGFKRSIVSSSSVRIPKNDCKVLLMSRSTQDDEVQCVLKVYGYYLIDAGNVQWEVGDAYGFEFAELTLPKNYIFGSGNDYSEKVTDPIKPVKKITYWEKGDTSDGNVEIAGLELDKSGEVKFEKIGSSEDPTQDRE